LISPHSYLHFARYSKTPREREITKIESNGDDDYEELNLGDDRTQQPILKGNLKFKIFIKNYNFLANLAFYLGF